MISRHQNAQATYEGLDKQSNALARGLIKVGVGKGDRVAVSLGNNMEFAIVSSKSCLTIQRRRRRRCDKLYVERQSLNDTRQPTHYSSSEQFS